uniref:ATP-grasp fold amidoligase family protein n=1 Tax=Candidatus Ruminimicrobium bovinum TaxID=3242779 RepID=UPI0039B9B780
MKIIFQKLKLFFQNSNYRFKVLQNHNLLNWVPDNFMLKLLFKQRLGISLNIKNPQTFNEKIQWLKLYDRNPLYTTMVDKYKVKEYIANMIGREYIIPTLGVWYKVEEINFDKLPNQFVLKTTHDSGGIVICKD